MKRNEDKGPKFHRTHPRVRRGPRAKSRIFRISGSHKSRQNRSLSARPVPFVLSRRDEAIDVSHARIRAAQRNLPFYVTHVSHVFTDNDLSCHRKDTSKEDQLMKQEKKKNYVHCFSLIQTHAYSKTGKWIAGQAADTSSLSLCRPFVSNPHRLSFHSAEQTNPIPCLAFQARFKIAPFDGQLMYKSLTSNRFEEIESNAFSPLKQTLADRIGH
ncbi:hypothetical protein DdX_15660 [Ditylenchus destructor]|uniref:Uncharacterized protein n=1 Tax=Ditylenchus destructor TaxID=166010 RepID=A0AAD4MQG7_9BILA|nr:hypothetical protein DdX_15660 [Ditylenchus destructor]